MAIDPSLTEYTPVDTNVSPSFAQTIDSTIILPRGGDIPSDLHDPRPCGSSYIGTGNYKNTHTAGSGVTSRMVATEEYGSVNGYGINVEGFHFLGGQTLSAPFLTNHNGEAAVADAIGMYGWMNSAKHNLIELFKGNGIVVDADDGEAESVTTVRPNFVLYNVIHRCFGGIYVLTSDSHVFGNIVAGVRDYGSYAQAGNIKYWGNHFYGCETAALRLGILASTGPCQVDFCDCSDSPVGIDVVSNGNKISNGYTQGCITGLNIAGTQTKISDYKVNVSLNSQINPSNLRQVGVDFAANTQLSNFLGGEIQLSTAGIGSSLDQKTLGIWIKSHMVDVIHTSLAAGGQNNVVGLLLDSTNIVGRTFDVDCTGFSGTGSLGVYVNQWGNGNTINIRGLVGEVGSPPTTVGNLLHIASDDWGTGNHIYVNGIELTQNTAYN